MTDISVCPRCKTSATVRLGPAMNVYYCNKCGKVIYDV